MTIYLDNNATTKLDGRVLEAMMEDLLGPPMNPSSIHAYGRKAHHLLLSSKDSIAKSLKIVPGGIIFTSSASEALNMVIKGAAKQFHKGGIVTTDLEHPSIDTTLKELKGFEIIYVRPLERGAPTLEQIQLSCKSDTKFIIISAVYSETGAMPNLKAIADFAKAMNICLIVDGTAWLGKEEITIYDGISAICFSAHKIHGPKGAGLAYINKGIKIVPLIHGGHQESGYRAGTENLAAILGFAKAIELLKDAAKFKARMERLRDLFEELLIKAKPDILVNGAEKRVCNVSNLSFPGIDGDTLFIEIDRKGVLASRGSACSSKAVLPSRILTNMGIAKEHINSSIRFSLSRHTTEEEIKAAVKIILEIIKN